MVQNAQVRPWLRSKYSRKRLCRSLLSTLWQLESRRYREVDVALTCLVVPLLDLREENWSDGAAERTAENEHQDEELQRVLMMQQREDSNERQEQVAA